MEEIGEAMDYLNILDPEKLDEVAEQVSKEKLEPDILHENKDDLNYWMREQKSRGVEKVTREQLVDSISNKGCPKDTAEELARILDVEGNGAIDLDTTELILNLYTSDSDPSKWDKALNLS